MNRIVRRQQTQEVIDSSYLLGITVTKTTLTEWCLALAMLHTGVIDVLTVAEPHRKP